jgi:hypothetical protein
MERRWNVHSTVANVLMIWFLMAALAALGVGAVLRSVSAAPAPVPVAKRARRIEPAPGAEEVDGIAECVCRR